MAAGVEYDRDTYTGEKKEKKVQEKEFESKNQVKKTGFKAHWKPLSEALKAKREKEKKSIVEKRAIEPEF